MTMPSTADLIRRRFPHVSAAVLTVALCTVAVPAWADSGPAGTTGGDTDAGARPTVVLVHGAFADASGWNGVIERLQADGYTVLAPPNPLRGLTSDSTYIASVLKNIKGPIVLAGHSYGGAVISSAAAGNPNVKSLVYVSAFMPDKGEVLGQLAAKFPGSELNPALSPTPFETASGKGTDLYIQPAKFHDTFAADLPAKTTAVMAAAQRPIAASAFTDKAPAAAWRTIPSWALVAKQDKSIAPDLERWEAERAGSHTVEIDSSHVAMISHPDAVTDLIRDAAGSSSASSPSASSSASAGKPALADTGSRSLALAGLGAVAAAAVLTGAGLVLVTRKRRDTPSDPDASTAR
ncbi:alpha/beta fold hydrolase [Streptomyces sp. NPDC008141]|uniref:alpha/beta fold hydrolase n=1 Tax=Streptomyces sp. NPDC008141 TaxID=3364815 RepID=UPI0036E20914